ncbi:t-SNARE protein [Purpureocillium lavendulum]|uniref:t-SNARE protein n=1 Tax=Purpureocillium lavendulum TaxID=1247861 RepID=A0AB34FQ88_9HYPO|nr:t-SNARE protein [Purpureocillium lavendulum]
MSYGQQSQNPYYQAPAQESGYEPGAHGYGQANPYAQDQYEMQDYGNQYSTRYEQQQPQQPPQQQQAPQQSAVLSQADFLDRVTTLRNNIRGLTTDIDTIGQLHQRTLSSTDGNARQQLTNYVEQTRSRNQAITEEIKSLELDVKKTHGPDLNTKKPQFESLRTFFKSELDKYHSVERDFEHRYRDQIARQYRIVNPDATEDEVQEAAQADWGNEGVFQTAMEQLRTNRTAQASSLLGNVRARHNELTQIEHTLAELGELYQRLAEEVIVHEDRIDAAETNAQKTVENIEEGNAQVKKASDHARRARKLKWWCFFIVCLIILAIALGVGLGICLTGNKCGGK